MIRVLMLTTDTISEAHLQRLRAVSPNIHLEARVARSLDEVPAEVLAAAEVLYLDWLLPTPQHAPNVRWVQGHFAGVDHLWPAPLFQQATLTTASGVHARPIAEYILMMMLAFAHRLPLMTREQAAKHWPTPRERWQWYMPRELADCTLGIVGYGSIGRETARLAKAFGMKVLATKRRAETPTDEGWREPHTGDPGHQWVDALYGPEGLPAVLAASDYVAVCVPLTAHTRHLLNAHTLGLMKPGAVVINIARGGVIDEAALVEALRSGHLGGAGLDVFEREPLPADSPLWDLPNVILSPHIAGFNPHYLERAMSIFEENLRRYAAGEPLLNVVDEQAGY